MSEHSADLFSTYVDLATALDAIGREDLWKITAKYGCPRKFLLCYIHCAAIAWWHTSKSSGQWRDVWVLSCLQTNGMKQGYVLAPTLFSLVVSAMPSDDFRDGNIGIRIRCWTYAKLWKSQEASGKIQNHDGHHQGLSVCCNLSLNTGLEADIQRSIDKFFTTCTNSGFIISIKKMEVLHQTAPEKPYVEPNITIKSQRLNAVNSFTSLGSTVPECHHKWQNKHQGCKSQSSLQQITCQHVDEKRRKSTDKAEAINTSCTTHVKHGQCTNAIPRSWTTSIQPASENSPTSSGRTRRQTLKSLPEWACAATTLSGNFLF